VKNAKRKGTEFERFVKREFEKRGFEVTRSAASLGKADLYVEGIGSVQCKARKTLSIYGLFDGADVLVVKANRKEPLIVMSLSKFLGMFQKTAEYPDW